MIGQLIEVFMEWLDSVWDVSYPIMIVAYYSVVFFAVFKLLLENKSPIKTHSYLLLLIVVPVIGLLVYIFLGQDYRKNKMYSRKKVLDRDLIQRYVNKQLQASDTPDFVKNDLIRSKLKIIKLLLNNNRSVLTRSNKVEILKNGEEKFPSLLEAIDKAKHHIHIEYYIFENDSIGKSIVDVLVKKAKEGVEIRFIYDDVGTSHLAHKFKKVFLESGVQFKPFSPVYVPQFSKANFRDHRKIVIIDGKVGFLGGMNVADRYINRDSKNRYWRDTHLKISGDAIKSLQIVFLLNWYFVSKESIGFEDKYFPTFEVNEKHCVQIAASGPDSDWASIMQAIFLAIATAKKEVLITTPYFIPNSSILTALKTAAMSGINVHILFPEKEDSKIVHAASMSYMREVLRAGVKVSLYTKGFIHAKTIVVDGIMSSVGTANMDYRSFDQNFEVNAIIYAPDVAKELSQQFKTDLEESIPLQLDRWKKRPIRKKILESTARLLAPLL